MANDFQMINDERVELTDEEQAFVNSERNHHLTVVKPARLFADLRRERNELLAGTDYLFGSDAPSMSNEKTQEWRTYRQALRDLPANTPNPAEINWPSAPD